MKRLVSRGVVNQYVAAIAACTSMVATGQCYGWINPVLTYLLSACCVAACTSMVATGQCYGWINPVLTYLLSACCVAACTSMVATGQCYGWINPVLTYLLSACCVAACTSMVATGQCYGWINPVLTYLLSACCVAACTSMVATGQCYGWINPVLTYLLSACCVAACTSMVATGQCYGWINPVLTYLLSACCVAACTSMVATGQCYGWINPVLTYLLSAESQVPMTSADLAWIVAIIEVGCLISPIPGGMLADKVGRKPVVLASAPLYIAGWLIVLYCTTPVWLGVARTIHGAALGLAYTGVPIYLGEIAGNNTRGAITSLFSISYWVGFVVSFAVAPFLSYYHFTWFSLIFNLPVLVLLSWQPESPYYYVMAGKEQKAYDSLKWFRDSSLEDLRVELDEIKASVKENENKLSFSDIISTPVDRKALLILNILLAVRTMSGIASFLVFTTEIFLLTPNLSVRPEVITIVFGVVMMCSGFIATITTDKCGRRPLLLISAVGCLLCQASLALYYYFLVDSSVGVSSFSWAAPVLVMVYALLCSAGMYPVGSAYTSELFTSNTRGLAASVATLNITVFCFISLVIYQPITDSVGLYGNFVVFAVILTFGSVYFYFVAPETKGKSFVQIREELGN